MVETTIGVQALGVGIAAFIATLTAAFLFINAWHERVARAFGVAMVATAVWGWIGFASNIAADHSYMEFARNLRIVSLMGNALLCVFFVRFALVYREERIPSGWRERAIFDVFCLGTAAIIGFLLMDLYGARLIVGEYPRGAVTPLRGAIYESFWIFYIASIVGIYLFMRGRLILETGPARRGHMILVYGLTIGASAGTAGFLIWYGIHWPLISAIRALAVPFMSVAAFYAMSSHNIFNIRVAAANVFVFAIWTFLFFRILLNQSLSSSGADILLLASLVLLGTLLIRSFNTEIDSRLRVERAEKDRAIEQSKAEFISIAAHQLRTPLAGIRWSFSALESAKSGMTKEQQELIRQASVRTKDVVERVNEMLRAARLSAGEGFTFALSPLDIRSALKESVELFSGAAATRDLKLNIVLPRKVLTARIDRDKFAMAVQNLIDNAIKYTNKGVVTVSAEQIKDRIHIRVADTGIGIAPDDRSHLFEKFYRAPDATKMYTDGSGLGLFIVKKIIDAHGGEVQIESIAGTGSTFTISIPATK